MRGALRPIVAKLPVLSRRSRSVTGSAAALVLGALAMFAHATAALGAESSRGFHVLPLGGVWPYAMTLDSGGTPWFTGSADATHVTAEGRVIRYHLPVKSDMFSIAWGADDALWAIDEDDGGVIRLAPDGRVTRYPWLWATADTLEGVDQPTSIIPGPDRTVWFGERSQHQIVSLASDGSSRVIVRLAGSFEPELLTTAIDGSVWFTDGSLFLTGGAGLRRVLSDGTIEAVRYQNDPIWDAASAPNGDIWFVRAMPTAAQTRIKQVDLARIDPQGHTTLYPAPSLTASVAVAADGTVWVAGKGLARMDPTGHFQRIYRAPRWRDAEVLAAPDGRLWILYGQGPTHAGWLPPNPCLSRRQITLHLHARRGDPIRTATLAVQGRLPRTFDGPDVTLPVDLRDYLPGSVHVRVTVRTAHRRYVRHRVYHACARAG